MIKSIPGNPTRKRRLCAHFLGHAFWCCAVLDSQVLNPEGSQRLAGGRAQRTPPDNVSSPLRRTPEGCQQIPCPRDVFLAVFPGNVRRMVRAGAGTPLGCESRWRNHFRGHRYAQPPANCCDPSGVKGHPRQRQINTISGNSAQPEQGLGTRRCCWTDP